MASENTQQLEDVKALLRRLSDEAANEDAPSQQQAKQVGTSPAGEGDDSVRAVESWPHPIEMPPPLNLNAAGPAPRVLASRPPQPATYEQDISPEQAALVPTEHAPQADTAPSAPPARRNYGLGVVAMAAVVSAGVSGGMSYLVIHETLSRHARAANTQKAGFSIAEVPSDRSPAASTKYTTSAGPADPDLSSEAGTLNIGEPLPQLGSADAYLTRAKESWDVGDVDIARLLYRRAAELGDVEAALLLAQSYDALAIGPELGARVGVDAEKAKLWYRRAVAMGADAATTSTEQISESPQRIDSPPGAESPLPESPSSDGPASKD